MTISGTVAICQSLRSKPETRGRSQSLAVPGRSASACDVPDAANAVANGLAGQVEVRCVPLAEAVRPDERYEVVVADPPWGPSADCGRFPEDPLRAIDGADGTILGTTRGGHSNMPINVRGRAGSTTTLWAGSHTPPGGITIAQPFSGSSDVWELDYRATRHFGAVVECPDGLQLAISRFGSAQLTVARAEDGANRLSGLSFGLQDPDPVEALRRWFHANVRLVATKKGMMEALQLVAAASPGLRAYSFERLTGAIRLLLDRAVAAGAVRSDIPPEDLLRTLLGIYYSQGSGDWQPATLRLVDVFVDGLRTR
mgnify:CR=1 FL=1